VQRSMNKRRDPGDKKIPLGAKRQIYSLGELGKGTAASIKTSSAHRVRKGPAQAYRELGGGHWRQN